MTSPVPAQIGRFRIVEELGRGAMGVVYRAVDPALDRSVAIKTILLSGDAEERAKYEARFLQEAKAAGRLSHPAIITIHDVGREGDLAYMALELLEGVELRTRLAESQLPVPQALEIVIQVAEGLAYAHQQGVVHRDIKPANVMILRSGRIKIMDFGIARLPISEVKTQTGMLLGTPKYMSPEQVRGNVVDHRSDIFSLGAMLYELLVGRPPFSGIDTPQLMLAIAQTPHPAPSRIVSRLPPLLDLIVARALEKDPAARYQSALDFAADLQACLVQMAAVPAPPPAATLADTHPRLAAPAFDTDKTLALAARVAEEPAATADSGSGTAMRSAFGATGLAPLAGFWPLSRRFDSSAALQALTQAGSRESRTLEFSQQRPPSGLARMLRDADLRSFAVIVLLSLAVSAAIVLL